MEHKTDRNAGREPQGAGEPGAAFAASRRRLLKGAAAAPVVYSVVGRPVWANENCTKSILLSGNLSAHPEQENCVIGCSPGFWKNATDQNWNETPYLRDTLFYDAFEIEKIAHIDFGEDENGDPIEPDPFPGKTLEQVLWKDVDADSDLTITGFHATAALLNASHSFVRDFYAYTDEQVRVEFRRAYARYLQDGDSSKLMTFKDQLDDYEDTESGPRVCPLSNSR